MTQVVTIQKTLKKGPKRGLTAAEVAARTGINLNSVRATLWTLQSDGSITVAGTVPASTGYGRPSNRYLLV